MSCDRASQEEKNNKNRINSKKVEDQQSTKSRLLIRSSPLLWTMGFYHDIRVPSLSGSLASSPPVSRSQSSALTRCPNGVEWTCRVGSGWWTWRGRIFLFLCTIMTCAELPFSWWSGTTTARRITEKSERREGITNRELPSKTTPS